jgi:lysophospholipase L1-like esterase
MKFLILLLFLISINTKSDIMIEHIKISKSPGKLKISPFTYVVNDKTVINQGASFAIAPTEKKNMVKAFKLGPAGYKNCWVFMPNKLPGRNITELQLFKVTPDVDSRGAKLLKEGSDYFLDKQGALCNTKKESTPFKVKAKFTFLPERYDSLFLNTKTNKIELLNGQKRDIDAEEYIPATPDNCKRLFNIVATGKKNHIIPTYKNTDCVQSGCLDRLKKKLKKGNKIKLLGYGDSITALQKGQPNYTPNGPTRDCFKRYFSRYPKDTLTKKVEKVDLNDGAGKVHCKIGWNWALVNNLEKTFGVKVDYLNCAIGGTHSGETKNQGLFPARIKKALDLKPDLVVLAFGMNEIGSNRTDKNMTEIIKQFKSAGADIIVMGVPQINGTRSKQEHNAWQKTNSILAKVAKEQKCPFIDTGKVNLGLNPEHICSANLYNHPGIHELRTYAECAWQSLYPRR